MTSFPAVLATNATRVHLFALLFIVLVAAIVIAFLVIAFVVIFRGRLRPAPGEPAERPVDSPQLVLARRLASGEIDDDEYRRRLAALRGEQVPPPA
ncbi:MAG: SHOCT domain-containing protein [Acidimicrobiales bacterium]